MFRGNHPLKMDAKGRLSMPTRYRSALAERCGGRLIATVGLHERCLMVYPSSDWQAIEDDLHRLPAVDQKAQRLRRLLIGNAGDCDMDSHGRILIPPVLRDFAGLERQVQMVGQGRKFELWGESAWSRHLDELLGQVDDLIGRPSDELRSLNL